MNCHKCPHHADVLAGKYCEREFSKVPCSSCNFTPSDSLAFPHFESNAAPPAPQFPETEPEALPEQFEAVAVIVRGLLSLPPELRDVVSYRFQGLTYEKIAALQGVTKASVEERHRRAMKHWPMLKVLFPAKFRRQKRNS